MSVDTKIKLLAVASWLENPSNDLLSEVKDEDLDTVAASLVFASMALKNAAENISEESEITPEKLDDLAALADVLDLTEDEFLKKQASVLDELLLTIAAPKNAIAEFKEREKQRLEDMKARYDLKSYEADKIADAKKAIEASPAMEPYKASEMPLKTRSCPDHAGIGIIRIGDDIWQCELDKKKYDYANGYTLYNGTKIPPSSVSNQSKVMQQLYTTVFDSRESRTKK